MYSALKSVTLAGLSIDGSECFASPNAGKTAPWLDKQRYTAIHFSSFVTLRGSTSNETPIEAFKNVIIIIIIFFAAPAPHTFVDDCTHAIFCSTLCHYIRRRAR